MLFNIITLAIKLALLICNEFTSEAQHFSFISYGNLFVQTMFYKKLTSKKHLSI